MSNKRGLIRDAIRDLLEPLFSFPVYTGRDVDGRKVPQFINVYLPTGDVEYAGLQKSTTAVLAVSYRVEDVVDDDDLDVVADKIEAAMKPQALGDLASGMLYDGFEYLDERERGFDGITLRFNVVY